MPPVQVSDALWHCLCPSFWRSSKGSLSTRKPRIGPQCLKTRPISTRVWQPIRGDSSTKKSPGSVSDDGNVSHRKPWMPPIRVQQSDSIQEPPVTVEQYNQEPELEQGLEYWEANPLQVYSKEQLRRYEDAELHKLLQQQATAGLRQPVSLIIDILTERGEELDVAHYQALILANCDAQYGSAEDVGKLLEEMEKSEIAADTDVYHAALKALAIHPDHLLRNIILEKLQQYWFPLSHDGWQWTIVGMIREKQMELALEKLQEMVELKFDPDPWFLSFLTVALLDMGEKREAFSIFKRRCEISEPLPSGLWDCVLSMAAHNFDYSLVAFVWRRAVVMQYINPSTGTCTDVLSVAARYGDFSMATDVFRILGQRSTAIQRHHYESLLEAYVVANDLNTSLTVLSIMTDTPTPPTQGSVTPLYTYLTRNRKRPHKALSILRSHRKQNKTISIFVFNAILEALGRFDELEEAFRVYSRIKELIPSGPITSTFNSLLRTCYESSEKDKSRERALFLVSEMRAMNIDPDQITYDRLILACLCTSDDATCSPESIDLAYKYWEEMCSYDWWPRERTLERLVAALTKNRDGRVWRILQVNAKLFPDEGGGIRRYVNRTWPKATEAVAYEDDDGNDGGLDGEVEDETQKDDAGLQGTAKVQHSKQRKKDRFTGMGGKWISKEEFETWEKGRRQ